MALSILTDEGFQFLGSWLSVKSKPHKAPWVRHQPGLYAFVVNGDVVYVGKAKALHRRLRSYSRRAFRDQVRPKRQAQIATSDGMTAAIEVKVYVKIMIDADDAGLFSAESAIIQKIRPIWNHAYSARVGVL